MIGECFRRKAPILLLGHPCENIPIFFHSVKFFKSMLKILYTLFQQQIDPLKRLPAAETSYLLNISLP